MPETGWAGIRHVLQDLDFPAPKEQIVQHAQTHGTDASVIRASAPNVLIAEKAPAKSGVGSRTSKDRTCTPIDWAALSVSLH